MEKKNLDNHFFRCKKNETYMYSNSRIKNGEKIFLIIIFLTYKQMRSWIQYITCIEKKINILPVYIGYDCITCIDN